MGIIGLLLLVPSTGAASFDFGITPSDQEAGIHDPGDKFFGSFFVVSGSEEELDVAVDTGVAKIKTYESREPKTAANFSEQACSGCIEFLTAGGKLQDYDKPGSVNQWKNVEYFVNVPEDAEPGYHMLQITATPKKAANSGSVGVVSAASFPIIYRVPGEAIRSARILGVHVDENTDNRQKIVVTAYNDGTVTIGADTRVVVETTDGNKTFRTGTRYIGPGESTTMTARVPTDDLKMENRTFQAWAVADYVTGETRLATELTAREPTETTRTSGALTQKPGSSPASLPYLIVLLVLVVSSVISWKVINHVRY